jgi:type IV secretion system protein VirB6
MELLGYFIFQLIGSYIDRKFFELSEVVYGNLAGMLMGVGVAMFTVYFMLAGLRMVSGESHESMTALVLRMTKMMILLSILHTSMFGGVYIQNRILGVRDNIVGAFAHDNGGSGQTVYQKIDSNLDTMAATMSLVDAVSAGNDVGLGDAKGRALTLGLVGQASPPIVAGLLVLINELGLRIAIMLAPIFIVAFMFKRTEDMFFTWVKFMLGSMLSLGVLSMVIAILFELTNRFTLALGALKLISAAGLLGSDTGLPQLNESVMTAGFGAVMTVMLLSVPVILNRFFGSDMGGYSHNPFSGLNQHKDNPMGNVNQYAGQRNSSSNNSSNNSNSNSSNSSSNTGNTSNSQTGSAATTQNINGNISNSAAQASGTSENVGAAGARGLAKTK